MTFETFDQGDEETWPDRKVWFFWIFLWNCEDYKDNEDNDIEKTPWMNDPRFVACETLITFLAIENNNLIIHSDPWIKNERDSIRNSCDVYSYKAPFGAYLAIQILVFTSTFSHKIME